MATLKIGSQTIRIHGIDAPETAHRCQLPKGTWDCAGAAADALAALTDDKTVPCVGHEFDQYGRLIARCKTDDEPDIGAKLVASGLAWAFVKYSADYINLEMAPRRLKVGIWQSKTQPPWEYRAQTLGDRDAGQSREMPDQGQHQRQGRADLSRTMVEALRPDEGRHVEGRAVVLH